MGRIAVALLGIGLIVLGFNLTVATNPWPPIVWLNFIVVVLAFLANYANLFLLKNSPPSFNRIIPSIGLTWVTTVGYSLLAITLIILSVQIPLSFKIALLLHLFLIFGVIVIAQMGVHANAHAVQVQRVEAYALASLDSVRNLWVAKGYMFKSNQVGTESILKDIERFEEDLRFLSASTQPETQVLDKQLLRSSEELFNSCESSGITDLQSQRVTEILKNMQAIMRQRKLTTQTGDYKEFLK